MSLEQAAVDIPVDGARMDGFMSFPAHTTGNLPGVIVAHDISGVSDYTRDVVRRLAEEGFAALAPNLFWKVGPPPPLGDRASFMRFRASMDDRQLLASLDAGIDFFREQSVVQGEKIGIIGFCMGGYHALLEAARNEAIKACVDFYGGPLVLPETSETRPRAPLDAARDLRIPFLGLFGEEDQGIPLEQVRQLDEALQETGVRYEIHTYPGAGHAFHNDTGERYRPEAAQDAWRRAVRFLKQALSE